MKKFIAIAAALLLVTFGAKAQTYVNIGAGTTKNITEIDGQDPASIGLSSFFGGVSHNFKFLGMFGVEVGLNYMDCSHTKDMTTLENSSVKYHYNELMAPVELNFGIGLGKLADVRLYAGPTFHYGLKDETVTTLLGKISSTVDAFEKDSESQFLTAASVGASVQLFSIRLKVGYQLGLGNLDETSAATKKKNFLTFGLGYAF